MNHDAAFEPSSHSDRAASQAAVNAPTFGEFDRWMDRQLTDLVARWQGCAAPAARRGAGQAALHRILRQHGQ